MKHPSASSPAALPAAPAPLTRRRFLRRSSAATAALAAPQVITSRLFGQGAPSNRITLGLIGAGNIGVAHLDTLLGYKDTVRVLGVCDVDRERRETSAARINQEYGSNDCRPYADFRELNRRREIDAVLVCTPDHWHALNALDAFRQGKDVYIEKPLTLTIAEGRALVDEARKYGRMVQHGTWQRSMKRFHDLVEFVRSGGLGKLQYVECLIGANNRHVGATWRPEPVPEGLDWDMWLGPAPWRPYTFFGCHYNFRFIADNASGQMTNLGAHCLDIGQWVLDADRSGPVEIEGHGDYPTSGLFTTPTRIDVTFRYANGVPMYCRTDLAVSGNNTSRFFGERGWLDIGYSRMSASDPQLLREMQAPNKRVKVPSSKNHYDDFFSAMRTRKGTIADAETSHRTTTVCNLGQIAMVLGRKLRWDPAKEEFVGDAMANRLRSRPMRAPWSLVCDLA
jgi:predicted dehydrogenase